MYVDISGSSHLLPWFTHLFSHYSHTTVLWLSSVNIYGTTKFTRPLITVLISFLVDLFPPPLTTCSSLFSFDFKTKGSLSSHTLWTLDLFLRVPQMGETL